METNKLWDCPSWVEALLWHIEKEIARVYWNRNQETWDSAFRNTGNSYKGDCFTVRAYVWEWGDKPEDIMKWNFKYGDIEISWYKHLGRCTTINKDPNKEGFNERMIEMHKSIMKELAEKDMEIE